MSSDFHHGGVASRDAFPSTCDPCNYTSANIYILRISRLKVVSRPYALCVEQQQLKPQELD